MLNSQSNLGVKHFEMGDKGQTKQSRFLNAGLKNQEASISPPPFSPGAEGGGGCFGDSLVARESNELAVRAGLPARCLAERFAERHARSALKWGCVAFCPRTTLKPNSGTSVSLRIPYSS